MWEQLVRWVALLGAIDVALALVLARVGLEPSEIVSGLLVADTMCVVWWYTSLTHDLAAAARRQADAIEKQVKLLQTQWEDAQRPCVVIDWSIKPGKGNAPDAGKYKARNVGQGIAVNVVHVDDLDAAEPKVTHIGALRAGDTVSLPSSLNMRLLQDEFGTDAHYVIAEQAGTNLWVITCNVRQPAGRMSHVVFTRPLPDQLVRQVGRESLSEYVRSHWSDIKGEFGAMKRDLEGE